MVQGESAVPSAGGKLHLTPSLCVMPGSSCPVPGRHVAGMEVGITARRLLGCCCSLPSSSFSLLGLAHPRWEERAEGPRVRGCATGTGKGAFPRAGVTRLTSPCARRRDSGSRNGRVGPARVPGARRPTPGCWRRRRLLRFAGLGGDRQTPSEGFARKRTIIPLLGPMPANRTKHHPGLRDARPG